VKSLSGFRDLKKPEFLFFRINVNGKIGTSEFAEFAADTLLRSRCHDFFHIVKLQNIFGAEVNADSASLAPVPIDRNLF
jgi:hypothetical protein